MAKVKKRLRIKWKNFIIFIIIVLFILFVIIKGISFTITTIKNSLANKPEVKEAKEAYERMAKDASKDKRKLVVMSAYRDYNYQVNLYNRYAKKDGKDKADTYSGRPGFSEHQTGLAIDLYNGKIVYTRFEETKEFKWMQDNAYKYGFILRFPKGKELETGYQYESWHYRYVGLEIAKEIKEKGICFEEYIAMQ